MIPVSVGGQTNNNTEGSESFFSGLTSDPSVGPPCERDVGSLSPFSFGHLVIALGEETRLRAGPLDSSPLTAADHIHGNAPYL
jgi:hypothetical protein